MKVVQIGDRDLASRRFNGHDLGKSLRSLGVDSDHLVWTKTQDNEYTTEISQDFQQRQSLEEYLKRLNKFYSSNSLFYPFSYGLLFDPTYLNSDVVHLHLIQNDFFDISHLPIISKIKPVVWTLHDLWPIQGHCLHSLNCDRWLIGCGECPELSREFAIQQDASALNWEYKKLIFASCDLDLIVASQWMYDRIKKSTFFKNSSLHLVNFGIDLSLFMPLSNATSIREYLKIPEKNIVIGFRASKWIYKGFDYIKACLDQLSNDYSITLLAFDEKDLLSDYSARFQVIDVGWVENDKRLIELYNTIDIFLMPSVAESFGMMAIEVMACGKPVIVMDNTALPEVVKPDESGCIVVKQGDVVELTRVLEKLITNTTIRTEIGYRSRKTVEKYYSNIDYVKKIISIYETAINRKKNDLHSQYVINQLKSIVPNNNFPLFPFSNVINVLPDSSSAKIEIDGISISTMEFKILALILKLERTQIIQFLLLKILKPIYKSVKYLFSSYHK